MIYTFLFVLFLISIFFINNQFTKEIIDAPVKKVAFKASHHSDPFIYADPSFFNGKQVKEIRETRYSYLLDSVGKKGAIEVYQFGDDGFMTSKKITYLKSDKTPYLETDYTFTWPDDYECCFISNGEVGENVLEFLKVLAKGFKPDSLKEIDTKIDDVNCYVLNAKGKFLSQRHIKNGELTEYSHIYNSSRKLERVEVRKPDGSLTVRNYNKYGLQELYDNQELIEDGNEVLIITGERIKAYDKNGNWLYTKNADGMMDMRHDVFNEYGKDGYLVKKTEIRLDKKGATVEHYDFVNGVNELVLFQSFPDGNIQKETPVNGHERYLKFEYDTYDNWLVKELYSSDAFNQNVLLKRVERDILYY